MSKEPVIPRETAEQQLEAFLDFYEIELDADDFSSEDEESKRKQIIDTKKRLIKAIMYGRLEITEGSEDFEVVQHLSKPMKGIPEGKLVWSGITGVAKATLTGEASASMMYKLCSALTGTTPSTIMALRNLDLSTAEALGSLFLLL